MELVPRSETVVPAKIFDHPSEMKWGVLEPARSASSRSLGENFSG